MCDQFVSSLELSGSSISDQTTLFDPINLGVTLTSLFIWQEHIDPALRGQRMPQGTPIYDAVTLDFAVVLKIGKKKREKKRAPFGDKKYKI